MKSIVASLVLLHTIAVYGFADEEVRTWSDASGKFSLQATYISCVDFQVSLRKGNGELLTIPVTRLCDQDQKYVGARVLESQKPPKEMADILAYLEVCRDAAIATLEMQKTERNSSAQDGDPTVDQEALDRYNEFREKNPNYGLPQGFNEQFGANSRERVEFARANERQRHVSKIKAIDGAIKELKSSLFVPTYTVRDFEQQLEAVRSIVYEPMLREKGLGDDADALKAAVRLDYKSIGYYKLRIHVDSILDENTAIVSARTGDDDAFDFSANFCLECDTQLIRVDSEFDLPNKLYFAKSLTKVSYATGDNTSVSDQTVLVLAPCSFTPKQLEEEFSRSKRIGATNFDPRREALSRLQKAKLLLKSDKSNSVSQMQEIIVKFPGTTAATEALAVLKNMPSS